MGGQGRPDPHVGATAVVAGGAAGVVSPAGTGGGRAVGAHDDRYKWIALSNTTLGVLMATLDASIMLIAMPDIFRGIHLDPLQPGNSFYLLWMILSFLIVSSVLVVSLGRLGDMFGRVRMYNLGFAVYTVASLDLDRRLAERPRPGRSTSSGSASCRASARPSSWRTPPPS